MKLSYAKVVAPLLAAAAALGLGACGRAEHVTDAVSGPGRHGGRPQIVAGCPSLVSNNPNSAFNLLLETGSVPQFRANRLRIQTVGDFAELSLGAAGACIAADVPTMNVIGGHANVFLHGTNTSVTTTGNRLTFGALVPLGVNVEPGIALGSDAQGNILEIIWPDLAGLGSGSPIVRVQLAAWNTAMVTAASSIDVTWDMTLEQDGVQTTLKGAAAGMGMDGAPVIGDAGLAIVPCPATLSGAGGSIVAMNASIPQFRPGKRLRMEVVGDVASKALNAVGGCAAADPATISFVSGSGNVFRGGTNISVTESGQAISFGPLLFPGVALEPGVVIASDASGNVLEIIWPGLAGLPAGAPIMRFQLTRWNSWIQTGRQVDMALTFNARAANGSTATFSARANGVSVPVAK